MNSVIKNAIITVIVIKLVEALITAFQKRLEAEASDPAQTSPAASEALTVTSEADNMTYQVSAASAPAFAASLTEGGTGYGGGASDDARANSSAGEPVQDSQTRAASLDDAKAGYSVKFREVTGLCYLG